LPSDIGKLIGSVLDRRYWTSTVNPPPIAPPPGAQPPPQVKQTNSFSSSMVSKMGDMSLGRDSTGGSGKKDGEKKEKKSLFKMKW